MTKWMEMTSQQRVDHLVETHVKSMGPMGLGSIAWYLREQTDGATVHEMFRAIKNLEKAGKIERYDEPGSGDERAWY